MPQEIVNCFEPETRQSQRTPPWGFHIYRKMQPLIIGGLFSVAELFNSSGVVGNFITICFYKY
jgi:hypothetical protein